jgi:tRNA(Ile)-lysidine synthase
LAHHESDLIENFFIRLFRGSGLKGLSSLNIKRHSENNILNLIRPLINTKKNELIYISKKSLNFILPIHQILNEKFLRTRIRNYLDKFKLDGLDINKIKLTLSNLRSANESINFYKEKSIKNHVRYLQRNCMFC